MSSRSISRRIETIVEDSNEPWCHSSDGDSAKNGANLAGQPIPGTNPVANYLGQTGNASVAVASLNTLIIPYQIGAGLRSQSDALLASVRVTSDQPIVVGSNLFSGPPHAVPCMFMHK